MSLYSEFKAFIQRGNVIDLAVGVIMGTAFGKIVTSLVGDVLMPPIGYLVGGIKFTDLKIKLPKKTIADINLEEATINIGNFIQATLDFIIIAVCVFVVVKAMNAMKRQEAIAPPPPTPTEALLREIRDLLKQDLPGQANREAPPA